MIAGIKRLIINLIILLKTPKIIIRYNSYSQAGEDIIVKYLFDCKKIKRLSYLDLGTCDPIKGNNTYLFYINGSCGVCVEADKNLIEKIRIMRPDDRILNCGIGIHDETESEFYVFEEPSLNTFNKKEADYRVANGSYKIINIEKVKMRTVNSIIIEYFRAAPDFLSIDLEGIDLEILQSIDLERFPVPVICVETCSYSEDHVKPKNRNIEKYMHSIGYFTYADTYINTIFVNMNWFYNKF